MHMEFCTSFLELLKLRTLPVLEQEAS